MLTTAATVTLDRLRYTEQVRSVTVALALLPGVNRADVLFAPGTEITAEPGADATIELDGGDGSATVISGTVDHLDRGPDGTLVTVTDGAAALAAVRPQETYSGLMAMQIVRRLAELADVSTGLIAAMAQTSAYVADPRRTAAQHIAALADRAGAVAAIDGEGELTLIQWPVGPPTVAMRRDREFTAIATSSHRLGHEFATVGAGGSGAALSPDTWLVNSEAVTNAKDPGPGRTWIPDPVLRTPNDVELANTSADRRRTSATRRLRAECWLQPARRPGEVVEIQEAEHPDQTGPWLLTAVSHELAWDRSRTLLSGVSGKSSDSLSADLGGVLGAIL